jgi:AcrB/AcrD/AcrF family protein
LASPQPSRCRLTSSRRSTFRSAIRNGATVFLRDIDHVRDGNLMQQNVVRADGKRSVLLNIIKNGNASTLTVVNAVKHVLNIARASAPSGMAIKPLFDQSVFVTSAMVSVFREGAIAAGLTALMILLFLGSWRLRMLGDGRIFRIPRLGVIGAAAIARPPPVLQTALADANPYDDPRTLRPARGALPLRAVWARRRPALRGRSRCRQCR